MVVDESGNEPGKVDNLEDMPMVVDDLGLSAEEVSEFFFENLKKESEGDEGGDEE